MICLQYTPLRVGESQHEAGIRLRDDMLCRFCGIALPSVVTDPGGKPRLADRPDITFSVSHSVEAAVCALSFPGISDAEDAFIVYDGEDAPEVGADVELVDSHSDLPRLRRLADRFFPEREADRLRHVPDSEYRIAFMKTWTALESFVKRTGEGFRHGFYHIDLSTVRRVTDTLEIGGKLYVFSVVYG